VMPGLGAFPGESPELAIGRTQLRTVQLSLRAHRDRILQAAVAAQQAIVGSLPVGSFAVDGLTVNAGVAPLTRDAEFVGLTGNVWSTVELSLTTAAPTLGALDAAIRVTPGRPRLPAEPSSRAPK